MAKPVSAEWRSLSWALEPEHALVEGRDDRVVVRLVRPRVGGATIALLFEARPVATCTGIFFEAADHFGATAPVAVRAPMQRLIEDAAATAETYFASRGTATADANLADFVHAAREAERLARRGALGSSGADVAAEAILAAFEAASVAAATRARPVAYLATELGIDRKTIQRFLARARELAGEEEDAGGSLLDRVKKVEQLLEGETDDARTT